jgi:hypothetical protein
MYAQSGLLYNIAKAAYDRMRTSSQASTSDALVAVVFAAASLESFINEMGTMAQEQSSYLLQPSSVSTFAQDFHELDARRGTTAQKFQLAYLLFSGRRIETGTNPYQDFQFLMCLRNDLVHLTPQDEFDISGSEPVPFTVTPPAKIVDGLRSRQLLAAADADPQLGWISLLSTHETARWACLAARSMVDLIIGVIPACTLKTAATTIFGAGFQRV